MIARVGVAHAPSARARNNRRASRPECRSAERSACRSRTAAPAPAVIVTALASARRPQPAACRDYRRRDRTSRPRPRAAPKAQTAGTTSRYLIFRFSSLLHRRRARIAEDRTRAERARAEFHAPLKPANRLAVGQGRRAVRRSASSSSRRRSGRPLSVRRLLDLVLRERGPEIGASHASSVAGGDLARLPSYM